MRRRCPILVALLIAALLGPAGALADGDPASDVLLGQDVYLPYSPAVSQRLIGALNGMTAAARRAGYPLKVAIIHGPVDLGVIPDLFGKPQKYADFLEQEIAFQGRPHLLVVMPAGYGAQGVGPAVASAVAGVAKPASAGSDDLARAAEHGIAAMTRAAGHPVSIGSGAGSGSGAAATIAIVIALVLVALAAITGLLVLRRRQPPPAT